MQKLSWQTRDITKWAESEPSGLFIQSLANTMGVKLFQASEGTF